MEERVILLYIHSITFFSQIRRDVRAQGRLARHKGPNISNDRQPIKINNISES